MNTQTKSIQRIKKALAAWWLCIIVCLAGSATLVTASATGATDITAIVELAYAIQANQFSYPLGSSSNQDQDWQDPSTAAQNSDITNYNISTYLTYSNLNSLANLVKTKQINSAKTPVLYRYANNAGVLLRGFESQTAFDTALRPLTVVNWSTTLNQRTPQPLEINDTNKVTSAIGSLTGAIAQGTVTDAFSSTFDMTEWNPNAGIAGAALSKVSSIASQIFYVISNVMMIGFFVLTGIDIMYLIIEPIRPLFSRNSGGTSINGDGRTGILSKIRIPIVSSAAIEATGGNNGGLGGGVNGANGGKGTMVLKYLAARAPALILGAIYLILVTLGYWQQLIGWLAGFVIQAFDWITSIGK